ncbi:hypothetical protein HPP92_012315 [Vanilla planifolia]|uniref:Cathepsin propeptide inhibitor domain-containing protein n=1 Tax=Vanilla planifolia TaxID=51239 RepID=A0A835UZJ4_VANPL|nr:hypothetical protein HPP92_012315 [Vanilla planifolia]
MTKVFLLVFFLLSVATASHMEMMDEDLETEDGHIKIMDEDLETEDSLWNLYERWISHNNVSRDPDEKQKRFKVSKDNARAIHQFNKRDDMSYKKAINMFADMTDEEFSATKTGFVIRRPTPAAPTPATPA